MSEKKKRVLTRKQRALRRIAILAVILLALTALGVVRLLPARGLRYMEEALGTGRTKVVWSDWTFTKQEGACKMYLSANENAVILAGCSVFGTQWNSDALYGTIDCSGEEQAVYAEISLVGGSAKGDTEDRMETYQPIRSFGRVDDPDVAAVEMLFTGVIYTDTGPVYQEMLVQRSERSEWMELDGRTYFLMETKKLEWEGETFFIPMLRALDSEGNLVAEYNVWNRAG